MILARSFERIGRYRIHAVHAGTGAPVVLLHGLSGSHHWWRYTIPVLAERHEVHAPELIGFGRSRPGTVPTIADMAAAVGAWLDRRGLRRAHLIGHSMGGQIAVHLTVAETDRVDRLVLAAASGIPRPLRFAEMARLLAELVPPRKWGRLGFWPTIALDAARAGPLTIVGAGRALLSDDVRPLLPSITRPTLLLWGENDPLIPVAHGQQMARLIPDARLTVLERAAHNAMADRPAAFNATVLRFLDGR
ncbi:MAG: alpha/beta fold hydrolase [Longimicrobiales bacterium]